MATEKNNVNADKTNANADLIKALGLPQDFDAEEQVGFAPYWSPEAGATFVARLVAKEEAEKDTDFTRYLLQAGEAIKCSRGPAANAEEVTVQPGEVFTISVYFALQGLFDFYLESGFMPWMKVQCLEERPTKKAGQTVWTWKLNVSKADRRKADQLRAAEKAAQLKAKESAKEAAQLQS